MHRGDVIAWLVVLLAGGSMTASAAAQPPPAQGEGREEERKELYRQGVDLAEAGHWAEAAERFSRVLAIRSSPKVRFTYAEAQEHVGLLATAYAAYAQALADARVAGESEVVQAAQDALSTLGPRVPSVRLQVSGATNPTATIDDHSAAIGEPVKVDPGAHRVAVQAPGARPVTSTIALGEGQRLDVPVKLELLTIAPPALPEAAVPPTSGGPPGETQGDTPNASPLPTIGLVTAGTGVVALGIGTAFALSAKSKNDQSNSSGCTGNACTDSAYAMRRDALSAASASTVSFIVGGLLAAGGVTLWLVAPRHDAALQVSPTASANGLGIRVEAVW